MHALTLFLFAAPVAMATKPLARSGLPKSFAQSKLLNVLATCGAGKVRCENGCMPIDGVCCNDNTDEYCLDGYYCVPNACCPIGKTCSGSSGGEASCNIGETECGDLCMPFDGTCCQDGLHYCPDFGTCTDDGYCCDLNDDCDGSSGGSFPDDDFTSTTSNTITKTATSTIDDESSSSSTSTRTTPAIPTVTEDDHTDGGDDADDTDTTNSPATPTPNAVVTTTVSQQAGGIFTADGRIAAGFAVAAALLV